MENKFTRYIYDRSPDLCKDIFTSIYGWQKNSHRYRGEYDKWYSFFSISRDWSFNELVDFQREKLREIVTHCYTTVPFYNEMFGKLNLHPDDIKEIEDLQKLPVLNRSDLVLAGDKLVSDKYDIRKLPKYRTSGSTGTPLNFYRSRNISNMEFAFVWNRYRKDMQRSDPWSLFSGLEIVSATKTKPPFWRNNWAANERMYSIFHMKEENLPHYYDSLNNRYSKFLTGYPSALYVIVDYMEKTGRKLTQPPEAFFSASEELQPLHEEKIQNILDCKVWNRYGQGELVGSITQYSCGHLHYDMDYSIIEFLPVGTEEGLIKAEIIGTHLHHYAWPLLRYRTGDLVLYDPNDTCELGIPGPVIRRIYGRTGQYFELPDGTRVSNISVMATRCKHIRQMQVIQEQAGEINLLIIKDSLYSKRDELNVIEQFRRKVGNELNINIRYVDEIERTRSGKYISIINRISKTP